MQKNRIIVIGLIIVIIMGVAYGSLLNRLKTLEAQINQGNFTQAQIDDLYTKINEVAPISIYGDRQRITVLEHEISRLKDLLLATNEITYIYGTITNIIAGEELQLEIETEDGVKLMNMAEKNRVDFVTEIGLVESSFETLIEKFELEKKRDFRDKYTFVVIDDEIRHIYQGTGQIPK